MYSFPLVTRGSVVTSCKTLFESHKSLSYNPLLLWCVILYSPYFNIIYLQGYVITIPGWEPLIASVPKVCCSLKPRKLLQWWYCRLTPFCLICKYRMIMNYCRSFHNLYFLNRKQNKTVSRKSFIRQRHTSKWWLQEKTMCVLWIFETKSIIKTQRCYRTRYGGRSIFK
jgi:hypothetical protein